MKKKRARSIQNAIVASPTGRNAILAMAVLGALAGTRTSLGASTTYYWDGNGASTGSGATTLAGNWGGGSAAAYWGTAQNGTSATTAALLDSTDTAVFSANDASGTANNYNGGYTVALGAAQSVAGIVINGQSVGSGNTGGTLTLSATGANTLTIGSGGVTLNGSNGDPTFSGNIALGADQTWTINNAHVWAISANVSGNATAGTTRTWTLGYANQFTPSISGIISDGGGGGNLSLNLNNTNGSTTGGAVYNVTGTNNSYTGKTFISQGVLQIASLKNVGGGNSSLGNATTVAAGTIDMGSTTFNAELRYNSSSASLSDRVINLAGTNDSVTISNNSTAVTSTLTLSGGFTAAAGTKSLIFSGSNTGNNTISGAIINDAATVSVSKTGAGTWILSNNNTFGGALSVSNGVLKVLGTNVNIASVNVSGGATLSLGASASLGSGAITLNAGNLLLGSDTNVTTNSSLTITSSGGGIGVTYTPTALPTITDNSGTTGGIYGIGYTGDGGVGSVAGVNALFTSNSRWFLGAFTGTTGVFTGTSLTAGNGTTFRIGGGGGTLTLQNDILVGANNVLIGSLASGGILTLSNGNTYTGNTTIQNGTVNVSSVNRVVGGTSSSSLGAPVTVANGNISIGSTSNAVGLNYTGSGETTDRILRFTGTTGTVTLSNSGAGNLVFASTPDFSPGAGSKTLILGNTTDSFGGSIGAVSNNSATNKTSITKVGLNNSTWILSGNNTYTGDTLVSGGVLQTTNATDLSTTYVNLNGASTTSEAVWQTQGTIARTLSSTSGNTSIQWNANSGFAAKGGKLTVTLNGNATLVWNGTAVFLGSGTSPMVFGSTTADNQIEVTNSINLNTTDTFARVITVEKGLGGDSALLSGALLNGNGTAPATGITKNGKGMLILSGQNTYSGFTTVSQGSLVAATNSAVAGNTTVGAFGTGYGPLGGAGLLAAATIDVGDGNSGAGTNPSLMIQGSFTVARPIAIHDSGTGNVFAIGGLADANAVYSAAISVSNFTNGNSFNVTQVATTGSNALTISGGLSGTNNASAKSIAFNNVGTVNVTTNAITSGGAGALSVMQSGTGTTNFMVANTYTGLTTISAGKLLVNNATGSGTGTGNVSILGGGTLGGNGTIAGKVTTASNTAVIAPGNSPGNLTIGSLDASAGARIREELGSTDAAGVSDHLIITGQLTGPTTGTGGLVMDLVSWGFDPAGPKTGVAYTLVTFGSSANLEDTDFSAVLTPGLVLDTTFGAGDGGGNDSFLLTGGSVQVQFSSVPEPTSLSLIGLGVGGLLARRRRKRASVAMV